MEDMKMAVYEDIESHNVTHENYDDLKSSKEGLSSEDKRRWRLLFVRSCIVTCLAVAIATIVTYVVMVNHIKDGSILQRLQNFCSQQACLYNGTCLEINDTFICSCRDGFSGRICEDTPCSGQPCKNDGICYIDPESYMFRCDCPAGYIGGKCEISPCATNPCQNGGTCRVNENGVATCSCRGGWAGATCSVSPCIHNPCENGGQCSLDAGGQAVCSCFGNWRGNTCLVSPCIHNPCKNGGKCSVDASGQAVCSCVGNWRGNTCMDSPCATNPCQNGGTCRVNKNGVATCSCRGWWTGATCSVSPCIHNPCKNGGKCSVYASGQAVCSCVGNWRGNTCMEKPSCPYGWLPFDGSCYYFSGSSYSWSSAKQHCRNRGGMLVEIDSYSENNFVKREAKKLSGTFWIGGTDSIQEGVWRWSTSGKRFSYTDWHRSTIYEPNNQDGEEHCASIDDELFYEWNDDRCWLRYKCICEKKLV